MEGKGGGGYTPTLTPMKTNPDLHFIPANSPIQYPGPPNIGNGEQIATITQEQFETFEKDFNEISQPVASYPRAGKQTDMDSTTSTKVDDAMDVDNVVNSRKRSSDSENSNSEGGGKTRKADTTTTIKSNPGKKASENNANSKQ